MSAEQLSKLSLGDTMVTTRAAARAQTSPGQGRHDTPSSSPISPTPSLIESSNGHRYDVSTFDDDLRRRAKIGLIKDDNNIRLRFCGETDDGAKYFFHLDDDITVKLEGERVPKCSCGAAQDNRACKHIFWILGQLSSVLPDNQTIQLARDGSSVKNKHPAEVIQRLTLTEFAENRHWIVEEDLPEEDELIDEVANMLSVFDPAEALPAEFKDKDVQELSEQALKYREVRAVVTEHAHRYPTFFLQLQEIISPAYQVKVFFDKIDKRIDRAMRALDEYVEKGPTNASSEALDVVNCALRLKALMEAIEEYYDDSLASDDGERRDDFDIERLSAAALVRILDEVTRRNYDAYEGSTWKMPTSNPEENNLFVYLIGSASEEEGFFVLDALQKRSNEAIRHQFMDLNDIEGRLRNTALTPPAYLAALRTLLNDKRKRPASQSGGSSAKRSMK